MSNTDSANGASFNDRNPLGDNELVQLKNCLRGLRFGSVTIIVQDGCIVQIDKTEKRRLRGGGGQQNAQHSNRIASQSE